MINGLWLIFVTAMCLGGALGILFGMWLTRREEHIADKAEAVRFESFVGMWFGGTDFAKWESEIERAA